MTEEVEPKPEKSKKGCLFYGGIGCLGLIIIISGLTIWGFMKAKAMVSPHEIEAVQLNKSEQEVFKQKVEVLRRGKSMTTQINPGEAVNTPVSITTRELSALMSGKEFGNHIVQVKTDDDAIHIKANIPIPEEFIKKMSSQNPSTVQQLNALLGKDNIVPANMSFRLYLKDDRVFFSLLEAKIMGFSLSTINEEKWNEFKEVDLLKKMGVDAPVLKDIFAKVKKLNIDGNGLHLIPE